MFDLHCLLAEPHLHLLLIDGGFICNPHEENVYKRIQMPTALAATHTRSHIPAQLCTQQL